MHTSRSGWNVRKLPSDQFAANDIIAHQRQCTPSKTRNSQQVTRETITIIDALRHLLMRMERPVFRNAQILYSCECVISLLLSLIIIILLLLRTQRFNHCIPYNFCAPH